MKISPLLSALTLILLPAQLILAQVQVDLIVFPTLTTIDYGAFATANDLRGAPRIFCAEISPEGVAVSLRGKIEWKPPEGGIYQELGSFKTEPFLSRTLCNDDIGTTDIRLREYTSNSDLTEENIKRGKPTGNYRLTVAVMDSLGLSTYDEDTEEISFLNPAQTLIIRSPQVGSENDIGNVLAEWEPVQGTESYIIKANVRRSSSQTLEEALNFGTPLINNRNVGNITSINLREILEREWQFGDEIVFQCTAKIAGPGGGQLLYSNIINFTIYNPEASRMQILISKLIEVFEKFGNTEFVQLLKSGEIDPRSIVIRKEDGSIMTLEELILFLETNPEAFINMIRQ